MPKLATSSYDLHDELECYLSSDMEDVRDGLLWWHERCTTFSHLSCMAGDYMSIPGKSQISISIPSCITYCFITFATSIDVECVFSEGWLLLSCMHSHLSIHLMHALLCLRTWRQHTLGISLENQTITVYTDGVRACFNNGKVNVFCGGGI